MLRSKLLPFAKFEWLRVWVPVILLCRRWTTYNRPFRDLAMWTAKMFSRSVKPVSLLKQGAWVGTMTKAIAMTTTSVGLNKQCGLKTNGVCSVNWTSFWPLAISGVWWTSSIAGQRHDRALCAGQCGRSLQDHAPFVGPRLFPRGHHHDCFQSSKKSSNARILEIGIHQGEFFAWILKWFRTACGSCDCFDFSLP